MVGGFGKREFFWLHPLHEAEADGEELMDILGVGELFFEIYRGEAIFEGFSITVDIGDIAVSAALYIAKG